MAFAIFERWSPEYALNNAFADMNTSGLEGLKKHLTANAVKTVEGVEIVSNIPQISILTSTLLGGDAAGILLGKLSDCDWTIRNVSKEGETAKAVAGFDYQDKMTGTVELSMIKEGDVWKIDKLAAPKFEKFTLKMDNQ